VVGDLTLHGVTKQVEIPFNYSPASGTFKGEFFVNREEYGIDGGGLKAIFVGDEIEITFNIPTSLKN
jgi:polyisoprenoid-binding protein YceI